MNTHFLRPMRNRTAAFSPKMAISASLAVLIVGGLGVLFFFRSQNVISGMVKERLRDEATLAAMQFAGEDVGQIRAPSDVQKPVFQEIYRKLSIIRHMPGVRSTYILRRTGDPMELEFVIDADLLLPFNELDKDGSGVIDPWEVSAEIGERYDISQIPALQGPAFRNPTTDEAVTHDKWGDTISGYAPIRTKEGKVVAVLGIDISASEYVFILRSVFSMQSLFLLLASIVIGAAIVLILFWKVKLDEMRRLDDERTWLLQLILHQIGSPLTMLNLGQEFLRESIALAAEKHREVNEGLSLIEDGASQLHHMIDVLVAADRVQSGQIEMHREDISLNMVIDEVISAMKPQLEKSAQKIEVIAPQSIHVKLDHQLLAGVLREIIDNAMTYSLHGSQITVTAERHAGEAEVRVTDNGAGIPRKDLPRIFERFARGSNASKYDPNGSGIGLFITRGIIERFGGKISAESGEGRGTTVTFTLPFK